MKTIILADQDLGFRVKVLIGLDIYQFQKIRMIRMILVKGYDLDYGIEHQEKLERGKEEK